MIARGDLRGALRIVLIALAVVWGEGQSAVGQTPWEITPYRCQVWLVCEPHPLMTAARRDALVAQLQRLLESHFGPAWELRVAEPSAEVRRRWEGPPEQWSTDVGSLDAVAYVDANRGNKANGNSTANGTDTKSEAVATDSRNHSDTSMTDVDKRFIVQLSVHPSELRVVTREFDATTHRWGDLLKRDVRQESHLTAAMAELISQAFTPLAMVHQVEAERVELRVRAGELLRGADDPVAIRTMDCLRAVLIPHDPYGKPRINQVRVVPWTVLQVVEGGGGRVTATLHSGFGQPLRTKRSRRLMQLGQLTRQRYEDTTVRIVNRADPAQRLRGYTLRESDAEGQPAAVLGVSDERGEVVVPRVDDRLQILLVQHGTRTVARLPLLAGTARVAELPLHDDDDRLEVEGFVQGVMDRLVDVVAERQVRVMQIRRKIDVGEFDEAEKLIDTLRSLESRGDFLDRVQRRQRLLAGDNRDLQTRAIDKLFGETRGLLEQYLDPLLPQRMMEEVRQLRAKTSSPVSAPASE